MNQKDVKRLLRIVQGKILHGEFTLSAGGTSQYYFDGRRVTLSSAGGYLVGKIVFDLIKDVGVEAIGGPSIGADPIVGEVMVISYLRGKSLAGFVIRGKAKGWGTQEQIEGNFPKNGKVVIVDDTLTTGSSVLRAIEAVEAEGCQVVKVVVLLDRQQGGSGELKKSGYDLAAIFNADAEGRVTINV